MLMENGCGVSGIVGNASNAAGSMVTCSAETLSQTTSAKDLNNDEDEEEDDENNATVIII